MANAPNPGSKNTMPGAPAEPWTLREETEFQLGYRMGREVGTRQGVSRVLQSHALEEMALKIRLLETMVDALSRELEARDKTLQFYRDTMRWLGE